MVVVWGANDTAKNEAKQALIYINNFVKSKKHINVLLVSVPARFDLISTSCVNKEVTIYNRKLHKWMKQYDHVEITDSESQRKYFTRHGIHMNLVGNKLMAKRITEHIKDHFEKRTISATELQWKQEMVKNTAPIREQDQETTTEKTTVCTQKNQTSSVNNFNPMDTLVSNTAIDGSGSEVNLPKRDNKCVKEKNEDFLWYWNQMEKGGKKTNNQKLERGERNSRNNTDTRKPYLSVMHQNIQSTGNKQLDVELALEVNLKNNDVLL
jgi:hypothetical protein